MKITTREELVNHIAHYKNQHKDIPLFEGFKFKDERQSFVRDVTIAAPCEVSITSTITSYGEGGPALMVGLHSVGSLNDRHLNGEQDYNDNWWFTTREEAEAHIRPKEFVLGKEYQWKNSNPHYNGKVECVYVGNKQGAFERSDKCLLIINVEHLLKGNLIPL